MWSSSLWGDREKQVNKQARKLRLEYVLLSSSGQGWYLGDIGAGSKEAKEGAI